MTLLKMIFTAFTFTAFTFNSAAQETPTPSPVVQDNQIIAKAGSSVITAKVNGLVCDFCAQALNKVFMKEEAVKALEVDLDAAEVRIELKEGQTLADERVKKLIRKSGYSLVSLNRDSGT